MHCLWFSIITFVFFLRSGHFSVLCSLQASLQASAPEQLLVCGFVHFRHQKPAQKFKGIGGGQTLLEQHYAVTTSCHGCSVLTCTCPLVQPNSCYFYTI